MTKRSSFIDIVICYNNKHLTSTSNKKFLGIVIEKSYSWKIHIDQLIPKLCATYYVTRLIKRFMSQDTLKLVCYSYFLSLMNYGITFWGNSSHIIYAFRLQKGVIKIIKVSRPRGSCRELLKKMKNFAISIPIERYIYIYIFLLFVVNHKDQYKLNYEIHSVNTRQLHPLPTTI